MCVREIKLQEFHIVGGNLLTNLRVLKQQFNPFLYMYSSSNGRRRYCQVLGMYYNIIRIKRGCLREGATIKNSPILIEPSLHI